MDVRLLEPVDRDEAVDVLIDAFEEYPVMRHVLGGSGSVTRDGLEALIGFYADKRFENGWPVFGASEEGRLVSVILVTPSGAQVTSVTARLEAQAKARLGDAAHARMMSFEAASDSNEPDGAFHFVGMLGVRSAAQGRGHGRLLLNVAKQRAIDDGVEGVALSTEDPKNLPFYERLGFTPTGHVHLDGSPPLDTWGLKWCVPRSPGHT